MTYFSVTQSSFSSEFHFQDKEYWRCFSAVVRFHHSVNIVGIDSGECIGSQHEGTINAACLDIANETIRIHNEIVQMVYDADYVRNDSEKID